MNRIQHTPAQTLKKALKISGAIASLGSLALFAAFINQDSRHWIYETVGYNAETGEVVPSAGTTPDAVVAAVQQATDLLTY